MSEQESRSRPVEMQPAGGNPTITVESILAEHVELDGCCIECGPCFKPSGMHGDQGCQGFPCPTVKGLTEAQAAHERGEYAWTATAWGWSVLTGHCGTCGAHDCHEGTCVVDKHGSCTLCGQHG